MSAVDILLVSIHTNRSRILISEHPEGLAGVVFVGDTFSIYTRSIRVGRVCSHFDIGPSGELCKCKQYVSHRELIYVSQHAQLIAANI